MDRLGAYLLVMLKDMLARLQRYIDRCACRRSVCTWRHKPVTPRGVAHYTWQHRPVDLQRFGRCTHGFWLAVRGSS